MRVLLNDLPDARHQARFKRMKRMALGPLPVDAAAVCIDRRRIRYRLDVPCRVPH